MLKRFLAAAMLGALTLSAAELTIQPTGIWKAAGEKEYSADFSGKDHPRIFIRSKVKQGEYYCFSFAAKDSAGAVKTAVTVEKDRFDFNLYQNYTQYSLYFKAKSDKITIALILLKGAGGKVAVNNISLQEVPADKLLNTNLIKYNDFEKGTSFQPRDSRFDKQIKIAESDFFAGKYSLKLEKPANGAAAVISTDLPSIPGKTATVKFWAKSDKPDTVCMLVFDFWRPNQNKHLHSNFNFKASTEWKEYSFTYTIPTDSAKYSALTEGLLRLQFHAMKSASAANVYLDNVEYSLK